MLRIVLIATTILISGIVAIPVGKAILSEESKLPKSKLYSFDNGVLEGGYSLTGNNNDARTTKGGGSVALNTNYAESVQFNKKPNGASNTQTAGTTGINAAVQLPVVSQTLLDKYGRKKKT